MKAKIQKIQNKRKVAFEKANATLTLISSLIDELTKLEKLKQTIEQPRNGISNNIALDIDTYKGKLIKEKNYWLKIKERFGRKTLNIGVVGRMGMGKSTFLQSITSLKNDVIPANPGGACTSTQSLIRHHVTKKYAKVHYYTEEGFIQEVLKPYYEHLSEIRKLGLANLPTSIQDFQNTRLPSPKSAMINLGEKKQIWLENLIKIQSTLREYKSFLSRKPKEIGIEDVKDYVAYKYDKSGNRISHIYNAIKKIEIFTDFSNKSIDNLGLIDIPGLGDFRLGDDERMIRSIGEDVDIILFIRLVSEGRVQWRPEDTDLYESAKSVLSEKLRIEHWSFMLLNDRYENNELCRTMKEKQYPQGKIKTADTFITNCIDEDATIETLDKVIDYMMENIEKLDKMVLDNSMKSLSLLLHELSGTLKKSQKEVGTDNSIGVFDQEFKLFYRRLSIALHDYRNGLLSSTAIKDDFTKEINSIINNCLRDINSTLRLPSIEKFKEDGIVTRSNRGEWDRLMHHIRPMLLKQFHKISYKQEETINQQKKNISKIFEKPELLGNMSVPAPTKDQPDLLFTLRDLINETMPEDADLRTGFNFICNFRFSYEGYLQNYIYSTIQEFFSKEIKELGSAPMIIKVIEDTKTVISEIKNEKHKKDKLLKDNSALKDTARFIVSGTKLLCKLSFLPPGLGELLGSIEEFGHAVVNFTSKDNSELETKAVSIQSEIKLREQKIGSILELKESMESVPNLIEYAIMACKEKLITNIADWPEKVSLSMVEEFIDHIRYTNSAKGDWRQLMYHLGKDIWPNYSKSGELIKINQNWVEETKRLSNQIDNFIAVRN